MYFVKASLKEPIYPFSSKAWAICALPRAPFPAISLTRFNSMLQPSSFNFATILSALLARELRIRSKLALNSWSEYSIKYPSTWTSPLGISVLSSTPGISVNDGNSLAASIAGTKPSIVSWSVSAITVKPAVTAVRTISAGE